MQIVIKRGQLWLLLSNKKLDFKRKKTVIRSKGHYIVIKVSIQEEDMTIISIYVPTIRAPKHALP